MVPKVFEPLKFNFIVLVRCLFLKPYHIWRIIINTLYNFPNWTTSKVREFSDNSIETGISASGENRQDEQCKFGYCLPKRFRLSASSEFYKQWKMTTHFIKEIWTEERDGSKHKLNK